MKKTLTFLKICVAMCFVVAGCATAPDRVSGRSRLDGDANDTLKQVQTTDPAFSTLIKGSSGYAVFPRIGKCGAVVGGSYGRGAVYEEGILIGFADITQATVGLQAGAQDFREIVVFESSQDLERFKAGELALAANYSAVALKSGAGKSAGHTDGVTVLVEPIGGLMLEAAVGGQQFTYQPR